MKWSSAKYLCTVCCTTILQDTVDTNLAKTTFTTVSICGILFLSGSDSLVRRQSFGSPVMAPSTRTRAIAICTRTVLSKLANKADCLVGALDTWHYFHMLLLAVASNLTSPFTLGTVVATACNTARNVWSTIYGLPMTHAIPKEATACQPSQNIFLRCLQR